MATRYILSCDGGGIRGAASAAFLEKLESELGINLAEKFDFFAGTSTGAIIVAGIGGKGWTAKKVAELYNYENANKIFDKSIWDKMLGAIQTEPKYDGKGKRRLLNKKLGVTKLANAKKPILISTYDVEKRRSRILKSYSSSSFKPGNITLAAAADASSAAPTYFPTVNVEKMWLIDGGVVANNPAMCAYAEAVKRFPGDEIKILSVGTGYRTRKIDGKESQGYGSIEWMRHDLLGVVMDESVVEYQINVILGDKYIRANSELIGIKDEMDDTSNQNLDALKKLGESWFNNNRETIGNFFKE
ncbi:patatin-like phospholipase family protein [Oceanicoccus sp. KOV_DT_Chl]|uniref:patatin-like phospholipase family protein n=1 Tax=Oceanicoccus sp. KOV_DT_Chl TaxID=1904639 RepID=UPI00135B29B7|nr:patatin-like phospholipase family protein [Oceanicoccus sp. KOV_DT_Chl]